MNVSVDTIGVHMLYSDSISQWLYMHIYIYRIAKENHDNLKLILLVYVVDIKYKIFKQVII